MNRWRGRPADEGVVAIVTALCLATFLLVVGAFAVDFGNAFARRQNLQTSADLATLAAAAMLPDRDAALGKAHEVLCSGKNENQVNGWGPSVCPPGPPGATPPAWMDDKSPANGEVTFYADTDNNGQYEEDEQAGTGVEATGVRIQTPPARVEFGLGSITGASGVDLTRTAMARMGSLTGPGGVQPIPVTPNETGTTCLSDDPGSGDGLPPNTGGEGPNTPSLRLSLLTNTVIDPGRTRLRVDVVGNLGIADIARVELAVRAYGDARPNNQPWPAYGPPRTVAASTALNPGGYEFTAPAYPPGASHVYLYLRITLPNDPTRISQWLELPYPSTDRCGSTVIRRNYIDEPRRGGTPNALLLNLQLGIDHAVRPWAATNPAPPVGQAECDHQIGQSLASGAVGAPVVNCLTVGAGLLVDRTHLTYLHPESPPSPPGGLLTRDGCPGTGGEVNLDGHPGIDDNSLFQPAFIPGSATFRADVEAAIRRGDGPGPGQAGALSPKVFLCPRLFTVPVLNAPLASRAISPGSYPVLGFKYLYIDSAAPSQGMELDGNRTVTKVHGILIDPAWFPVTASLPLPIGEYLGENLTKQVALVHDFGDPGT